MAVRVQFENNNDIGAFSNLTNTYCLVTSGGTEAFYAAYEAELASTIPVIRTTIAESRVLGRMCVGNGKGLLMPQYTSDAEVFVLIEHMPETVEMRRIHEQTFSALGNVIACNDSVALVHPEFDERIVEIIGDVLDVEVFPQKIGRNPLVGAYSVLGNEGGLVHPETSIQDQQELSSMLNIPIVAGTVNNGSSVLGAGLVVNDWVAFAGTTTTATEIWNIENVFKCNKDKQPPVRRCPDCQRRLPHVIVRR